MTTYTRAARIGFAVAFILLAAGTHAASSFDDFATDPTIIGAWTEYGYFRPDSTTATWNAGDLDLDLAKAGGNNGLGLYRTTHTRLPTDSVTLTVKALARTSGTFGFLGLMIAAVPQPGYVTTADDSYTLRLDLTGPGTFRFLVTRTYLDGTGTFILYSGASQPFAGPYVLEISRVGDHYEFRANATLLYSTATPAAGDFYNTAAKDSLIYYQVVIAGDGAMTATVDDFGVPPSGPALTLDGSQNGDNFAAYLPVGALIGTLDMLNVAGGSKTYSLVAGVGDTDNSKFAIVNTNELRTAQLVSANASVRIEGNDGAGTILEQAFTLTVMSLPAPVQYWRFDDGAGSAAANAIPGGNAGTVMGAPAWINAGLEPQLTARGTGASTAALDLETGNNAYVNGGNINLSTGGGDDVTVSMWLKPESLSTDQRLIAWLSPGGTGSGTLRLNSGNLEVFQGGVGYLSLAAAPLSAGTWYHLAFVWTGSSVEAFVDGVAQTTQTANFDFAGGDFGIGAKFRNSFGFTFDGTIDDVAVFNVALSASEVADVAAGASLYVPAVELTGDTIQSNEPPGTLVGTLSMVNVAGGSPTYSLVAGAGDSNNASFEIVNTNELRSIHFLHADASVRIEGNDGAGTITANAFTITVNPFPEPLQYWLLDDASGSTAANQIPAGNTGTLVGAPPWIAAGLEPQLTGRSILPSTAAIDFVPYDYLDGGNINLTSTSGGGAVTVSMWLNPDTLTGDDRIIGQLSGATSQAGAVGEGNAGTGSLWVWTGAGFGQIAGAGALSVGTWQHLALVWLNGTVTAYIDGVAQLTATADFAFAAANFGVGAKYVGLHGDGFDGKIDDVAVFNVALSAAQVASAARGNALVPKPRGTVFRFR